MKSIAVFFLLALSAFADVPPGEWVTQGGVTALVMKIHVADLALAGIPYSGNVPDNFQVLLRTTAPATVAFRVTIVYQIGDGAPITVSDVVAVQADGRFSLVSLPGADLSNAAIKSLKIDELQAIVSTSFQ